MPPSQAIRRALAGTVWGWHWPRRKQAEAGGTLWERFESIGDNCEFGFVQRHHGVEPSGLLRWARAPLPGVLGGLRAGFADICRFEDLLPYASDMVADRKYGIAFHSTIRCAGEPGHPVWAQDEEERRRLHQAEIGKFLHLRDNTLAALRSASKIFVFKCNDGLSGAEIAELKTCLDAYSARTRLLCVVPEATTPTRGVALVRPGVKLAAIDRLASYFDVTDASYDAWDAILAAAWDTPWR